MLPLMFQAEKHDKNGPLYRRETVEQGIKNMICTNDYFFRKAKKMTTDADKAIETTKKVMEEFSTVLHQFSAVEKNVVEQSKKAAGNIKDAGEKLAQGLARIEKSANFDRLERYVTLLERAATAMKALSDLEKTGHLEKIAKAIS